MTFLSTVGDGATDRSYGVHVADLAGVPGPVVERSHDVLDRLREETAIEAKGSGSETSPDNRVSAGGVAGRRRGGHGASLLSRVQEWQRRLEG